MKKILSLCYAAAILLAACSKTDDNGHTSSIIINGKSYKTVKIGNLTWTSQNYDGPGGTASTNNDEVTVGKFYRLEELNNVVLLSGWRIPTRSDFNNLLSSQGTLCINNNTYTSLNEQFTGHLRATSGWEINGDNLSGFNSLAAGYMQTGVFYGSSAYAIFWSSTPGVNQNDSTFHFVLNLRVVPGTGPNSGQFAVTDNEEIFNNEGFNLRFVKDN